MPTAPAACRAPRSRARTRRSAGLPARPDAARSRQHQRRLPQRAPGQAGAAARRATCCGSATGSAFWWRCPPDGSTAWTFQEVTKGYWAGPALLAALAPARLVAADRSAGDHPGRDRRRQGGRGARDRRLERAAGAVRRGQLRGAARDAGRGRAVRLPQGRVLGRRARARRLSARGRRRDAAPRRDRRSAAAASRPSCCARSSSARWCRSANRGRSPIDVRLPGRDAEPPAAGGRGEALSRRSAGAARGADRGDPAAARARRGGAVPVREARRAAPRPPPPRRASIRGSSNGCARTTGPSTCASWPCWCGACSRSIPTPPCSITAALSERLRPQRDSVRARLRRPGDPRRP